MSTGQGHREAWLPGVSPGQNSSLAVGRREEPSRQRTGLSKIFGHATTKGAQPKATFVTEERLRERNSLRSQTRKLRARSERENSVAHQLFGRTELGPNSPSCLPPRLRSSGATGSKRCRHNSNQSRCPAYLQSQTHLQHPGLWLQKAPFCGASSGDFGLTASELWAGVCSVLAENCESL